MSALCVECGLRPYTVAGDGLCDVCAGDVLERLDGLAFKAARAVAASDWHAAVALVRDAVEIVDRVSAPGRDAWRAALRGLEVVLDARRVPGSRELAAELVRLELLALLDGREREPFGRLWALLDTAGHRELEAARSLARR